MKRVLLLGLAVGAVGLVLASVGAEFWKPTAGAVLVLLFFAGVLQL